MARGIKDKVAILGMGCARFGERWEADADTLMVEAYEEALEDAGIETGQLDADRRQNNGPKQSKNNCHIDKRMINLPKKWKLCDVFRQAP